MIEQQIRLMVQTEVAAQLEAIFGTLPEVQKAEIEPLDIHAIISRFLQEMGIPAHIKGYQFLREAITTVYEDGDAINTLTKGLYPAIATKFNTLPTRVERAMRHAIEIAWTHSNLETITELFGYVLKTNKFKPTNGHFIAMVADKLRIEHK
ncbi:hypothetical protein EHS13_20140 [Paenibacillus psychroresistens]|uniref:Sporulation initiation factor Spo0A C-terminal domain-containing protein n=1 Tax=Paenibacillus psychroresistens TaxID=1778678 RepID=A0A6B8RLY3_9BACL|nr:hypothetical protein EHS13_20140 [Paenibacillus psychroresistens]